jgi:MoxR-like ATPase
VPSKFGAVASGNSTLPAPHPSAVSCITCPAYMDPQRQTSVIGTNVGSATCGKKLLTIGRPGSKSEKTAPALLASKCADFNKPAVLQNGQNIPIEYTVAFPDLVAQSQVADRPESVRDCQDCDNFVPERVVEKGTGWSAGFCRAKGSLLLTDRLGMYPKTCDFRSVSRGGRHFSSRWDELSITLFPELMDPVNRADPKFILKRLREGNFDDPREFQNPDKKVSPVAANLGIRAWRRIDDQSGFGPSVWLPVFDIQTIKPESVPPWWDLNAELAKIPQIEHDERPHKYIDHANLVYLTTVMWVKLGLTPALWGPAGVGKTEFFRHIAWLMQLPFERVAITASSEIDDIAGKMMYSPERGTYFHLGRVSRAWAKPNVLDIDEPNTGPPEVWQFLRPLTDNAKQLVLDQDEGQRITKHLAAYLGMAMNPAWDNRNTGIAELADPDASRLMHITLDLPPEEIERGIIEQTLIDDRWQPGAELDKTVDTLMKVAKDLRQLSAEDTIPISWGIRNQLAVARVKRYMTWRMAFRVGAADALEPAAREIVMDTVSSLCREGE